jgi:hypothetical protein
MNFVCRACLRKHHLVASTIPHVAQVYAAFQRTLDELEASQRKVVVLPAVDRFYRVLSEDVNLTGLNVVSVLDTRAHRIGVEFLGRTTQALTAESAAAQLGAVAIVLPWVEYDSAVATLRAAGFRPEDIVCWNEYFARSMLSEEQSAATPAPRVGFGAPLPETFAPSKARPYHELGSALASGSRSG